MTGQGLAAAIEYATTTLVKDGSVEISAMVDMALDMDKAATKLDNIKIQGRLSEPEHIHLLKKKVDDVVENLDRP